MQSLMWFIFFELRLDRVGSTKCEGLSSAAFTFGDPCKKCTFTCKQENFSVFQKELWKKSSFLNF